MLKEFERYNPVMTGARFAFRRRQKKTGAAGISPAPEMNPPVRSRTRRVRRWTNSPWRGELGPFAGQQNPTCGTAPFFGAIRGTENPNEIRALRRAGASGTAVAKRFRVIESTSRPHSIQISIIEVMMIRLRSTTARQADLRFLLTSPNHVNPVNPVLFLC
jgi:hypothetical protein